MIVIVILVSSFHLPGLSRSRMLSLDHFSLETEAAIEAQIFRYPAPQSDL